LQVTTNSYQVARPCAKPTLTVSPPLQQATGGSVRLTAATSGCPNPRYRFWVQQPNGAWSVGQDYGTFGTFNWSASGTAGNYGLEVDVRDALASVSYDAVTNLSYRLNGCSAV